MSDADTTNQLNQRRISDIDLSSLIKAYEAGGITHGFAPQVLISLYELSNRRAAERMRSSSGDLLTREQFDAELRALGERMANDGKIVIKQLLHEAEVNGRAKCLFNNWPDHLKADAYRRLGVEPVERFRRVASQA